MEKRDERRRVYGAVMKHILWPLVLTITVVLLLLPAGLAWSIQDGAAGSPLAIAVSYLFPAGLTLIVWSALPRERAASMAGVATVALALAVAGYLISGFAFEFGGVASVSDSVGLQQLDHFYALVRGNASTGWGFVGLEGFVLSDGAATPAALQLFLSQLPLVMAAVLLVVLALPRRTPFIAQLLAGLAVAAVTYPLAGHWVNGGGWLARLGGTLSMGHGTVDLGGSGTLFVLAAATASAAAVVFGRRPDTAAQPSVDSPGPLPPSQFPITATLGAFLVLVGWMGMALGNPLYAEKTTVLSWPALAVSGIAALAGGALAAQLISWFTTGGFDALMGPHGALAGLAAISAGAAFVSPWAALLIGAVGGFLLVLVIFLLRRVARSEHASVSVFGYGVAGFWGLMAVALFAEGRWGQGWNSVSSPNGQGVTGLLVSAGMQPDIGQLSAQIWGGIVLALLGFLLPWGAFRLVGLLSRLRQRRSLPALPEMEDPAKELPLTGERQGTLGRLDRVVNVEDRS
jgi:Amt family ammonium transporter